MSSDPRVGQSTFERPAAELQQFGALPWRINRSGKIRILLVTSRRRARWIIPKGWPLKDKAPIFAASREAFEEAGIVGDIYPQPITDYRYMKLLDDGSVRACRVTVFSMKVHGTLNNWQEQHQRKRRWFSVEEAAQRLDDQELAEFVGLHGPVPKSWPRSTSRSLPMRDRRDLETS